MADLRRELEVPAYDDVGHGHNEQQEHKIQHDQNSLRMNQDNTQIMAIKRINHRSGMAVSE